MDKSRYPIGFFKPNENPSKHERVNLINQIPDITMSIRELIKNLTHDQFQIPYREGGWTIQQIIHHLADNDMNAYLRIKRALTEENPKANSYREDLCAELIDYTKTPIEDSLMLIEILHRRLHILLKELQQEDFKRRLRTEVLGSITLDIAIQRFVWHNQHHMAQIESLIRNKRW